MSLRRRMRDRAQAALSVVKSFSIAAPGGVKFQLDVDAAPGSADTGDIEQDLPDLFVEIGEVARAGGTGALFLIDEMQNLDRASLGAICMALHRVRQRDLPVAFVGAVQNRRRPRVVCSRPTYQPPRRPRPAAGAPIGPHTPMQFDREFDIPLDRADARILVRTGGRPVEEYAVLLQLQVGGQWMTIRLIDNHLDEHHMHRYDGPSKRQPGERFAIGKINEVLPKAIEHLAAAANSIVDSWKTKL